LTYFSQEGLFKLVNPSGELNHYGLGFTRIILGSTNHKFLKTHQESGREKHYEKRKNLIKKHFV